MQQDASEIGERTSGRTRRVRAPNPGLMTLDGTNSYLIDGSDAVSANGASDRVVVVDPGPLDEEHLRTLAAAGTVELVLLTHRHADHSAARSRFAELTGAPVRAFDAALCIAAEPLTDGEELRVGGTRITVIHTPGHTSDSVCFFLPDDGDHGAMLTGDTILGRGTTIIDDPDGTLHDYLVSLSALAEFGPARVLPAHGPAHPNLAEICDDYLRHRELRLDQIRRVLAELGQDAPVQAVTDAVYGDTNASVRFAAEASVRAQLTYLRGQSG
jgi:glyoxylase-like metal-dependent hydrolase (beta-lactamase superfamily II)